MCAEVNLNLHCNVVAQQVALKHCPYYLPITVMTFNYMTCVHTFYDSVNICKLDTKRVNIAF